MRDKGGTLLNNSIVKNSYVWGALGLCSVLLAATVYVPILAEVLDVARPGLSGWLLIFGMSLLPLVAGQIVLAVMKSRTVG